MNVINTNDKTLGVWVNDDLPNILEKSAIKLDGKNLDLTDSMLGWGSDSVVVVEDVSRDLANSLGRSWIVVPTQSELEKGQVSEKVNIDEFTVVRDIKERDVKNLTENLGAGILMKLNIMAAVMEGVVKGIEGGITAVKHWDVIVCGIAELAGGGAQMISLNPITIGMGLVRVAASVKIMWDAYSKLTPEQVQMIVTDSKASVEAIGLLAKANGESLERVQVHLKEAQERAKSIEKCLDDVAKITTNGNEEIIILQYDAKMHFKFTQAALNVAQERFTSADWFSKKAEIKFKEVIDALNVMLSLFNAQGGTDQDKINVLAELTKRIATTADEAYRQMNKAQELRDEGYTLLNEVSTCQSMSMLAYGKAIGVATATMEKMSEKAQEAKVKNRVVIENVVNAADEISKNIIPTNQDIEQLAKEVAADLGTLESIISDSSGRLRMLLCATGSVLLSGIMGTLPAVILSYLVVQYTHTVINAITNWLARKVVVDSKVFNVNDQISYEFNPKASSFLRRIKGKVDQTEGTLWVKVGAHKSAYQFNLDKKGSSLQEISLFNLRTQIGKAVDNEQISKEEGLQLIQDLKTCKIEREVKNWRFQDVKVEKTGFIAENEVRLKQVLRVLGDRTVDVKKQDPTDEEILDSQYCEMRAAAVLFC
ncbi:MAG: hypothetical protein C5B43_04575 [Verrucomicrobia bacterium]|nr:MAG: hypothetical protein C5B43_04575 [Verrucomicrobiota bacterium]